MGILFHSKFKIQSNKPPSGVLAQNHQVWFPSRKKEQKMWYFNFGIDKDFWSLRIQTKNRKHERITLKLQTENCRTAQFDDENDIKPLGRWKNTSNTILIIGWLRNLVLKIEALHFRQKRRIQGFLIAIIFCQSHLLTILPWNRSYWPVSQGFSLYVFCTKYFKQINNFDFLTQMRVNFQI